MCKRMQNLEKPNLTRLYCNKIKNIIILIFTGLESHYNDETVHFEERNTISYSQFYLNKISKIYILPSKD